MSEIIGTILILAITMVLVATVFAFVLRSPPPQTSPTEDFSVAVTSNATSLTNVSILYQLGPALAGGSTYLASVGLSSSSNGAAFPSLFNLASGHISPSTTWNPGQTWWLKLGSYHLPANDNLTVKVFSRQQLIFYQVAPGPQVAVAPHIASVWTNPTALVHGTPYTIYATISIPNGLGTGSVKINVSSVGGPLGLQSMSANTTSGVAYWYYTPTAYPASAGTYNVILYVTDSLGDSNSDVASLTFT